MNTNLRYFLIASLCCFCYIVIMTFLKTYRPSNALLPEFTERNLDLDLNPPFRSSTSWPAKHDVSPEILSKNLVIRRAYLDNRRREGHKNAVVFLLEMKRSLNSSMFTGCRVGSTVSSKVHLRKSLAYEWAILNKNVTKNVGFVDCFDVDGVRHGDPAFLYISHSESEKGIEVMSQRNVVVPLQSKKINPSEPTVVTCVSTIRLGEISPSDDGMLYQWLRYQKTIGVDHVHMIAEDTFVTKGGLKHPIICHALKENFLSIDFWPRWLNTTEIFYSSQHLASNDCVYRFQGVYDYIIISDSDDFFVPCGNSKIIKPYLKKWCSGKKATCRFEWYQFYPENGWSPESVGPDGNLTATVHCQKIKRINNLKSVHQIRALVEVGRHSAKQVLPGYHKNSNIPLREAYFGHVRKRYSAPAGLC